MKIELNVVPGSNFDICVYVVRTSSSFHINFQETLRFDPASFADASGFIKRADNALRTV
jgi:hypothetical protein